MENDLISNDMLLKLHPIDEGDVDIEAGRITRNSTDILAKMGDLIASVTDDIALP